jgi:hypothetical protein
VGIFRAFSAGRSAAVSVVEVLYLMHTAVLGPGICDQLMPTTRLSLNRGISSSKALVRQWRLVVRYS